jgi:hypothetical protein
MLNMAQRPYSAVLLDVTPESHVIESPKTKRSCANYVPVAIELTSNNIAAVCTVFITLPGQKRRNVCLGSTLISTSASKQNIFLNKPAQRIAQQNV